MWGWEQNAQDILENQWNFERNWYEKANVNLYNLSEGNKTISLKRNLSLISSKGNYKYICDWMLEELYACYEWLKWNLLTITNSFKRGVVYYYKLHNRLISIIHIILYNILSVELMIDKNDEDINSHQRLNLYEWSIIDMN